MRLIKLIEVTVWPATGGMVAALAVVAIACRIGRLGNASDWAAWVQAIGSIAGILAAVAVGEWQAKSSRDLVREQANADLRRRIEALLGMLQAANQEAWRCRRFLVRLNPPDRFGNGQSSRKIRNPFEADMIRLESVLAAIPLHELPSWGLADAVLDMRALLTATDSRTTTLYRRCAMGLPTAELSNPLVDELNRSKKILAAAFDEADRLLGAALKRGATEFHQDPETAPVMSPEDVAALMLEHSEAHDPAISDGEPVHGGPPASGHN